MLPKLQTDYKDTQRIYWGIVIWAVFGTRASILYKAIVGSIPNSAEITTRDKIKNPIYLTYLLSQ